MNNMNESEIDQNKEINNTKLYSLVSIGGATFLGGPLAAGYMIGENYKALNKPKEGKISLIIGVVATVLLFGGIFMIPEHILEHIPRQLIPLIYIGIVWGIVEWKQGEALKAHKAVGNAFYSGWRAAGIGFVSLVIIFAGTFAFISLDLNNDVYNEYDQELSVFSQNETETLVFYDHLNTESRNALIFELKSKAIPKWKENVQIIKRVSELENLPSELIRQNNLLLTYSELRVETFELFMKAIEEDTDEYQVELEEIHQEIEEQLEFLNN